VQAPASAGPTESNTPIYISRNYALQWSGQAISYVGDSVFFITLLLWIAARIGAGQSWAPAAVSGLLACIFVPSLVGGRWPASSSIDGTSGARCWSQMP
jgi:hypothetical protein